MTKWQFEFRYYVRQSKEIIKGCMVSIKMLWVWKGEFINQKWLTINGIILH